MDRMLYLAMTGARQTMVAQAVNTNNLANTSTTGFKADLEQFRAMPVFGPGQPSRVYAMTERPATDLSFGSINQTGRELDVAIQGDGWLAVQAPDGSEAYTRAGELRVEPSGLLVTGGGHLVLGEGGTPISIPPAEKLEIGVDGTISIRPVGQGENALATLDRIKLVNPELAELTKGEDGLMRTRNGEPALADANVRVISGALETSNVNAVEAMVNMIELARHYEMQVKMMSAAKETDAASTKLLSMA